MAKKTTSKKAMTQSSKKKAFSDSDSADCKCVADFADALAFIISESERWQRAVNLNVFTSDRLLTLLINFCDHFKNSVNLYYVSMRNLVSRVADIICKKRNISDKRMAMMMNGLNVRFGKAYNIFYEQCIQYLQNINGYMDENSIRRSKHVNAAQVKRIYSVLKASLKHQDSYFDSYCVSAIHRIKDNVDIPESYDTSNLELIWDAVNKQAEGLSQDAPKPSPIISEFHKIIKERLYDLRGQAKDDVIDAIHKAIKSASGVDEYVSYVKGFPSTRWSMDMIGVLERFKASVAQEGGNLAIYRNDDDLQAYWKCLQAEIGWLKRFDTVNFKMGESYSPDCKGGTLECPLEKARAKLQEERALQGEKFEGLANFILGETDVVDECDNSDDIPRHVVAKKKKRQGRKALSTKEVEFRKEILMLIADRGARTISQFCDDWNEQNTGSRRLVRNDIENFQRYFSIKDSRKD